MGGIFQSAQHWPNSAPIEVKGKISWCTPLTPVDLHQGCIWPTLRRKIKQQQEMSFIYSASSI